MKKKNKRAMVAYYSSILFNTFRNIDMAHFIPLDNKLQKLVVGIEPIQDLYGYANPWPSGGGVNKLPSTPSMDTTVNDVRFTSDGNGKYTIVGTASGSNTLVDCAFDAPITLPSSDIYVHLMNNGANANANLFFFNGTTLVAGITFGAVNRIYKLTNLTGATIDKISIIVGNGETVNITCTPMLCLDNVAKNFSSYSNICPISGRSSVNVFVSPTLNPLDGTITNIPLGTTVYFGQLDVLTGVLTITAAGTSVTGGFAEATNGVFYKEAVFSSVAPSTASEFLSSYFDTRNVVVTGTVEANQYPELLCYQNIGTVVRILIKTSAFASVSDFNTALSNEPLDIVLSLATPQTIQLTPQQINTIVGSWDYIWCDSGKIIEIEG